MKTITWIVKTNLSNDYQYAMRLPVDLYMEAKKEGGMPVIRRLRREFKKELNNG